MSASLNAESDFIVLAEDLAMLKRDVAGLIEHMKGSATNTVRNAAGQMRRSAQRLRTEAGAEGERSADAVSLFVEARPFVALMIAGGIGYLGARVLRR